MHICGRRNSPASLKGSELIDRLGRNILDGTEISKFRLDCIEVAHRGGHGGVDIAFSDFLLGRLQWLCLLV
jgi:hypothetical protein